MTRRLRTLLVVSAATTVAGTTAVLTLAAITETYGRDAASLVLALAAVWLTQGITALIRPRTRERRP